MGVRTKKRVNPIGGNNAGAEVIDANHINEDPKTINDNENVLIPPITPTKKKKISVRRTKTPHTSQKTKKQKSFFEWLFFSN
tara:strand:+ start:877 stop:1122 length:246 start_codon:yes stop_codon:yes gene_type:complete